MIDTKTKIINDYKGAGEMVEIPCSRKYSNGQSVHVCKETGLVRAKDIRSAEETAADWSNHIFANEFTDTTYTARIPLMKARHVLVAEYADVEIQLRGKYLCDIGGGEGQFLQIAASNDYGCKVFGVEPSLKNCQLMNENSIPNFNGTVEEYYQWENFSKKKFDVITIMWTLSAASSPLKVLKIAHEMLKNNGHLIVAESSRIMVPFKKPLNTYFSKLPVDLHPFHFSAKSLKNLFKASCFEICLENRYLEQNDLIIIGKKQDNDFFEKDQDYELEDYLKVLDYFQRWDEDTQGFYS